MEDKIRAILASVLHVPADAIQDHSGPESLSAWDSLRHMKLILVLEEEFGLEFSDEQILGMTSLPRIVSTLRHCLPPTSDNCPHGAGLRS